MFKNKKKTMESNPVYKVNWDNRVESSEAATTLHNYINKPQAAKPAFKYE